MLVKAMLEPKGGGRRAPGHPPSCLVTLAAKRRCQRQSAATRADPAEASTPCETTPRSFEQRAGSWAERSTSKQNSATRRRDRSQVDSPPLLSRPEVEQSAQRAPATGRSMCARGHVRSRPRRRLSGSRSLNCLRRACRTLEAIAPEVAQIELRAHRPIVLSTSHRLPTSSNMRLIALAGLAALGAVSAQSVSGSSSREGLSHAGAV